MAFAVDSVHVPVVQKAPDVDVINVSCWGAGGGVVSSPGSLLTPICVSTSDVGLAVVVGPVVDVGCGVVSVGPVTPVLPVGPVGPVVPVLPVGPVLPVEPVGPVAPVLPVGPVLPVEPVAPVLGTVLLPVLTDELEPVVPIAAVLLPFDEALSLPQLAAMRLKPTAAMSFGRNERRLRLGARSEE